MCAFRATISSPTGITGSYRSVFCWSSHAGTRTNVSVEEVRCSSRINSFDSVTLGLAREQVCSASSSGRRWPDNYFSTAADDRVEYLRPQGSNLIVYVHSHTYTSNQFYCILFEPSRMQLTANTCHFTKSRHSLHCSLNVKNEYILGDFVHRFGPFPARTFFDFRGAVAERPDVTASMEIIQAMRPYVYRSHETHLSNVKQKTCHAP